MVGPRTLSRREGARIREPAPLNSVGNGFGKRASLLSPRAERRYFPRVGTTIVADKGQTYWDAEVSLLRSIVSEEKTIFFPS